MEDRSDASRETFIADLWDQQAVDTARVRGIREGMDVPRGAFSCHGSYADCEHSAPGLAQPRVGTALESPPGLGGPREFAVPGHQLIALMEHVAAVRRLARRGWRYD